MFLTHGLLKNVSFHFQLFGDFPHYLSYINFSQDSIVVGEGLLSDISSSQSLEGYFLVQDMEFLVYASQAFEKTANSSSHLTHMKWCELRKVMEVLISLTVAALLSFQVVSDSL